ncbi:MAG: tryptophan synthase subunit alpha [Acidimicrobiales bacterium]
MELEPHLRLARDRGRKLLIPYVTAGATPDWPDAVRAIADAGADAIEIGIPFSDPMMDGPVIQQASLVALQAGTTPSGVLDTLASMEPGVPLVVMTYYNIVFRASERRFAGRLAEVGVSGAILPDLQLDEAGSWCVAADAAGVASVLLVAPSTPDERAMAICSRSRGFVYGVGVMGITGERASLATSARQAAARLRRFTDLPVCIGVGVSTPGQAAQVCADADGVIVGSALVRRMLDGATPQDAADFVGAIRKALDSL